MDWFKGAYVAGVVIAGSELIYNIIKDVVSSKKPSHTIYNETLLHGKYTKEIYDDGKVVFIYENHPKRGKYKTTKYPDGRKVCEYFK